jgi:hypothetical protein
MFAVSGHGYEFDMSSRSGLWLAVTAVAVIWCGVKRPDRLALESRAAESVMCAKDGWSLVGPQPAAHACDLKHGQ